MQTTGLERAVEKMRAAGVNPAAIEVFRHYYGEVASGATGLIREAEIEPLTDVAKAADVDVDPDAARAALDQTVMIKLNGGLGTSMGLDRAKTLLPVREGRSFLDVTARQVLAARERTGARLPVVFMTSFRTHDDTLRALADYPLEVDGLPLAFQQSQEPKLLADSLEPVEWERDPSLEWCPPGHGDLYPALLGSGLLDQLIERGYRYASVANGDNLGAYPSAELAGWFAASGAPYAAELCRRTANDRKGGHLAVRKTDGRLILRDTAMTAPEEMEYFTDLDRHPYFHTNNLWFALEPLRDRLRANDGVLGLPLIRNTKTVDPADPSTPEVVQIETAMGTAIGVFAGATAVVVDRGRFLPVKTTNELLLLRSDCYVFDDADRIVARRDGQPTVRLDEQYYKRIGDFEERIPEAPSLVEAKALTVEGDWTFAPGVVVRGDAHLADEGSARTASGVIEG